MAESDYDGSEGQGSYAPELDPWVYHAGLDPDPEVLMLSECFADLIVDPRSDLDAVQQGIMGLGKMTQGTEMIQVNRSVLIRLAFTLHFEDGRPDMQREAIRTFLGLASWTQWPGMIQAGGSRCGGAGVIRLLGSPHDAVAQTAAWFITTLNEGSLRREYPRRYSLHFVRLGVIPALLRAMEAAALSQRHAVLRHAVQALASFLPVLLRDEAPAQFEPALPLLRRLCHYPDVIVAEAAMKAMRFDAHGDTHEHNDEDNDVSSSDGDEREPADGVDGHAHAASREADTPHFTVVDPDVHDSAPAPRAVDTHGPQQELAVQDVPVATASTFWPIAAARRFLKSIIGIKRSREE